MLLGEFQILITLCLVETTGLSGREIENKVE
jgi:hypothetical protein